MLGFSYWYLTEIFILKIFFFFFEIGTHCVALANPTYLKALQELTPVRKVFAPSNHKFLPRSAWNRYAFNSGAQCPLEKVFHFFSSWELSVRGMKMAHYLKTSKRLHTEMIPPFLSLILVLSLIISLIKINSSFYI